MANVTQASLNDFMSETQDQLLKLFEKELVFGKYIQILIIYFLIYKCINYKHYYLLPTIDCHILSYPHVCIMLRGYILMYSVTRTWVEQSLIN